MGRDKNECAGDSSRKRAREEPQDQHAGRASQVLILLHSPSTLFACLDILIYIWCQISHFILFCPLLRQFTVASSCFLDVL